jgi:predicted amidohydrolase
MRTLKIALLQLSDQCSLEGNLEHGLDAFEAAVRRGADIALLPEIWSHGYRFFEDGDMVGAKPGGARRP